MAIKISVSPVGATCITRVFHPRLDMSPLRGLLVCEAYRHQSENEVILWKCKSWRYVKLKDPRDYQTTNIHLNMERGYDIIVWCELRVE